MVSASKVECAYLFINTRETILVKTTLEEMVNPQLSTAMKVENSTCNGIMSIKIQKKISKEMYMQFYWVRDRFKKNTLTYF